MKNKTLMIQSISKILIMPKITQLIFKHIIINRNRISFKTLYKVSSSINNLYRFHNKQKNLILMLNLINISTKYQEMKNLNPEQIPSLPKNRFSLA